MLRNYIRIAWRNFQKNFLYSVINVLGLSVGLASAIIILLYVQHELTVDEHHENHDFIYRLGIEIGIGGPPVKAGISPYPAGPDLTDLFPEIDGFVRMFAMDLVSSEILIQYEENSLYEKGTLLVDSNFFDIFTHPVVYGDPAASLRHNNIAVLTKSKAERIFGPGDPVGKHFVFDKEHQVEVGAVIEDIPDNSHLKFRMLMYYRSLNGIIGEGARSDSYFTNNFFTYVLANQDLNTPEFEEKLDAFVQDRIYSDFREQVVDGSFKLHLRPMKELYFLKDELYEPFNPEEIPAKGDRVFVYIFITVAIILLSIAAVNYMNMAIARSAKRSKEVGVRKVLGADKTSLIRQFLAESVLISFVALLIALLWVELSMPTFNQLMSKNLSLTLFYDLPLLAFVLALVIFTGLLSGSYPALYLSGFRPVEVLKRQISLSDRNLLVRKLLVGFQFTISVFMIIATLVVVQQLFFMRNKDLGYETERIVILNVHDLGSHQRENLKNEIMQMAVVEKVSLSSNIPGPGIGLQQWGFQIESEDGFVERMTGVYRVDPFFAEVYGLELVEGRFFDHNLPTDLAESVVVNETAVSLFGWDDPVGKKVRHFGDPENGGRRVVGVVRDFHVNSFEQQISPLVILPEEQGTQISIWLKSDAGPGVLQAIEGVWHDIAGFLPMRHQFMNERHHLSIQSHENLGRLFALFAALCVFLSLMGLFGLAGFSAEQKTREIGIRVVHGATTLNILQLLYREFIWLMLIAIAVASAAAFYFTDSWLAHFAYRIDMSPLPFLMSGLIAMLVSLLTVGYHAVRSSGINPVEALKYE